MDVFWTRDVDALTTRIQRNPYTVKVASDSNSFRIVQHARQTSFANGNQTQSTSVRTRLQTPKHEQTLSAHS